MALNSPFSRLLCLALLPLFAASCATGGSKRELSKPQHARALLQIANGAISEGDPTGALEMLLKAEAEDPSLPEIPHSKGIAFLMKGDANTALSEVRRALAMKPDYPEASTTLGKLLMDSGRTAEAIPHLQKAANNPVFRESYKPLTSLGIIYYRRGEYAKSRLHLDRAIANAQGAACIAFYYRGHIELRESRLNQAIHDYDQASRKFCAGFAEAHLALGIAYEKSSRHELARKKFIEVQQQFPATQIAAQAVSRLQSLP